MKDVAKACAVAAATAIGAALVALAVDAFKEWRKPKPPPAVVKPKRRKKRSTKK